jgi:hypothetical protein
MRTRTLLILVLVVAAVAATLAFNHDKVESLHNRLFHAIHGH